MSISVFLVTSDTEYVPAKFDTVTLVIFRIIWIKMVFSGFLEHFPPKLVGWSHMLKNKGSAAELHNQQGMID
jgi:hypothetical protein